MFTRTHCAGVLVGRVSRGGESKRSVCVCRRWRGAANRVAAAVCRCRRPANGGPIARRQSVFKQFPAHREQLLCSTPEPRRVDRLSPLPDGDRRRSGMRAKNRIPPRAATQHTDTVHARACVLDALYTYYYYSASNDKSLIHDTWCSRGNCTVVLCVVLFTVLYFCEVIS